MTLNEFETLLKTVEPNVYHLEAEKEQLPYIVWSEYRKLYRYADNRAQQDKWRVQVDYYTKDRRASAGVHIEETLIENEVPFRYTRTFDKDQKVVRHLFDCEVT